MKKKTLIIINSLLTALLGLFGFNSCFRVAYGAPYATSMVEGTITDENDEPLKNIQVTVMDVDIRELYLQGFFHDIGEDGTPSEFLCYTNESGFYEWTSTEYFCDSLHIIVQDTSGVYATDSIRVKIKYNRSGVAGNDPLNQGKGLIQQDFQLKKN